MSATTTTSKPLVSIRPRRSWLPTRPSEIWAFRELMMRFAARDITLRYRQAVLGVVWVILVPLLGAGVLSFVFGGVADLKSPPGVPYFVFTMSGMVAWTAFSQIATRASSSLVSNSQLVGKVYFPRLLLPFSTVLSTLVDVAVSLVLLAVLLVLNRVNPGIAVLLCPLWFLLFIALALGVGLTAGALMVRYRDIQYILPVAVQFLLFASPVAYALGSVPSGAERLYQMNPLSGLLEGIRWSLIGTPAPSGALIGYAAGMSLLSLFVGTMVFSRLENQFADVI